MPQENPSMSRAHFKLLASLIDQFDDWSDDEQKAEFAQHVAEHLHQTNPNFKHDTFVEAATKTAVDDDDDETD